MASVTGYVQWIFIDPDAQFAKFGVGPSPSDTQLMAVIMDSTDTAQQSAMKASLVDAFSTALGTRREVTASYSSTDSTVYSLELSRA